MKTKPIRVMTVVILAAIAPMALADGHIEIEKAWIRSAPPGTMMLAGYAILRNSGDASVVISGAQSAAFADVSLHESINENGVERMRPLGDLTIAPGASMVFAPNGKHFMLMQPQHELKAGESIKIHLDTKTGTGADAVFVVRDDAP
jgi:copper(I)-binding protein